MAKQNSVRRKTRTDEIIHPKERYKGELDTPKAYNTFFANVVRRLADKIETVDDAWVCPGIDVWLHVPGEVSAEVMLSPMVKKRTGPQSPRTFGKLQKK